MRVLIVTQSYRPVHGGIAEHARNLGLALCARGHDVRVLTSGPAPAQGEDEPFPVLRVGRRFHVRSNGARASLALHVAYREAVRPIVRSAELIHVHSPLEPFLPWAVLKEARVPCIGTFHNAGDPHWGYRLLGPLLAPLAARLTVRTAVSRCAAAFAGRHFPGEFLLVPNGVDPVRFHPAAEAGRRRRSASRPVLLFVGRLEPRKGIPVLVAAVEKLRRGGARSPRLIVVGDGSLRARLHDAARRAHIDLDWRGAIGPAVLPAVYREADVFIAPALSGESFGIVLLEALASGLPVVASRIEGFEELLGGCCAARLFPAGDAGSLAQEVEAELRGLEAEASADASEARTATAARAFALRYSWDRVAAATEEAYREALGENLASVPRLIFQHLEGKEVAIHPVSSRETGRAGA
ncbi:MAG: glycosyltransferase family 4 protein [Candidatus Eisenbacteria bacterium]